MGEVVVGDKRLEVQKKGKVWEYRFGDEETVRTTRNVKDILLDVVELESGLERGSMEILDETTLAIEVSGYNVIVHFPETPGDEIEERFEVEGRTLRLNSTSVLSQDESNFLLLHFLNTEYFYPNAIQKVGEVGKKLVDGIRKKLEESVKKQVSTSLFNGVEVSIKPEGDKYYWKVKDGEKEVSGVSEYVADAYLDVLREVFKEEVELYHPAYFLSSLSPPVAYVPYFPDDEVVLRIGDVNVHITEDDEVILRRMKGKEVEYDEEGVHIPAVNFLSEEQLEPLRRAFLREKFVEDLTPVLNTLSHLVEKGKELSQEKRGKVKP